MYLDGWSPRRTCATWLRGAFVAFFRALLSCAHAPFRQVHEKWLI
jgi:hypothetical protein